MRVSSLINPDFAEPPLHQQQSTNQLLLDDNQATTASSALAAAIARQGGLNQGVFGTSIGSSTTSL